MVMWETPTALTKKISVERGPWYTNPNAWHVFDDVIVVATFRRLSDALEFANKLNQT